MQWLTKATRFAEEITLFHLHFWLTRLCCYKLNYQEEALSHGKTVYDLAMRLQEQVSYGGHDVVFKAAVRLADMLHPKLMADTWMQGSTFRKRLIGSLL